jgi:hypothetical protein
MTPILAEPADIDDGGRDGDADRAALAPDAESLARLKKTLAALAHVHGILVRLRDRAAQEPATSEGVASRPSARDRR